MKDLCLKNLKALSCFCSIYILVFLALIYYINPSADDYSFYIYAGESGMFRFGYNFCLWWQGTYTVNILCGITSLFSNLFYAVKITIGLLFLLGFFSIAYIVSFYINLTKNNFWLIFQITIILQALWFTIPSGLNEYFYWSNGALYYYSTSIVILCQIACILRVFYSNKQTNILIYIITCILTFLSAGMFPCTSVLQLIPLTFLIYKSFRDKNKKQFILACLLLVIAIFGFALMYFAPGTLRRVASVQKDFLNIIKITFLFGVKSFIKFISTFSIYIVTIPIICKQNKILKLNNILIFAYIFIIEFIIACTFQFLSAYTQAQEFAPRSESIVLFIMLVVWCLFFLNVFFRIAPNNYVSNTKIIYKNWYLFAIILFIISNNFIYALHDHITGPLLAHQLEQRYLYFKQNPNKNQIVPILRAPTKHIAIWDIWFEDKTHWTYLAYLRFWNISGFETGPGILFKTEGSDILNYKQNIGVNDMYDTLIEMTRNNALTFFELNPYQLYLMTELAYNDHIQAQLYLSSYYKNKNNILGYINAIRWYLIAMISNNS